jgi:hypothetical protein
LNLGPTDYELLPFLNKETMMSQPALLCGAMHIYIMGLKNLQEAYDAILKLIMPHEAL